MYAAAPPEGPLSENITPSSARAAALLGTACRIGGIVADLPRPLIDTLTTFGRCYGMAFQVVDDILDLVATDEELGKPSMHTVVREILEDKIFLDASNDVVMAVDDAPDPSGAPNLDDL